MFKKLKDKLAEEVKSSPQRIQQIAQAAQAAVTSASSSISDITNSDLFSIGDNDPQHPRTSRPPSSVNSQQNTFQDIPLVLPLQSSTDTMEYSMTSQDAHDNQRQRRLSNSSFASDVSFRLPSYETPSMYHLQSDMEVSASEAEERGFSSGTVSLDRVTKEQLYAAYRRTQERYTKYRTQYGDLARHYKLLERENAKARSVLVETQDKALRRISELREQCSLEQSAKAHLEKALRIEIEEKNMKIETLDTKIKLLQEHSRDSVSDTSDIQYKPSEGEADVQLINFSNDAEIKHKNDESAELLVLNNKLEKMEQLLNKYKDSLKTSKEKNSQITTELQLLTNEIENKNKELEKITIITAKFTEAEDKIRELTQLNEELQNQVNIFQFNQSKGQSTLEIDYQKALEEIKDLRSKIDTFSKREEDYAISLAENKLSIHKELESKETEIRSLKDALEISKKELQSQSIIISDYKTNLASLEAERSKLMHNNSELTSSMTKLTDLESSIEELTKKHHSLEQAKVKVDEAYKLLELQMKQENAEKLAMVDRNSYLENRNAQLSEENTKKSTQISKLESELQDRDQFIKTIEDEESKEDELFEELNMWKDKYAKLESEIQEERDELIKLQTEIEKLLANHELLQTQNIEYSQLLSELRAENVYLQEKLLNNNKIKSSCFKLASDIKEVKTLTKLISNDAKSLQIINTQAFASLVKQIHYALNNIPKSDTNANIETELQMKNILLQQEIKSFNVKFETLSQELILIKDENNNLKTTINGLELEKNFLDEEIKRVTDHYEAAIGQLNTVKENNEVFLNKIKEFENNFQNLQIAKDFEKKQYMDSVEKLENENKKMLDKIKDSDYEINSSRAELDSVKNDYKSTVEELDRVRQENESLLSRTETLEKQIDHIKVLQEDNKNLTVENLSLKSQAQGLTEKYNNLELEVTDIRKSHAEIVSEKNRLNDVIQKLEINSYKETSEQLTQTDNEGEQTIITSLEPQIAVENVIVDDTQELVDLTETKPLENPELNIELSNEYTTLKTEYEIMKDENRRFKSDIEGLQTYLTKISKENSILNDKLRELIATSEHATENTEVSSQLLDLKRELELSKDKIHDLLRENTIIVEENLELKDQIQNQNYLKADDTKLLKTETDDSVHLDEKYNNLLHVNNTLEKRLMDLEQMNKSVDGNAKQMRENNDKLRLTNEKLERRLDEALVSLRHLHSLQENTELEYLKNILYEYLTGPGMHSLTLAKVLSAIVKFDDIQTKLVLQKEKERQGFLRQLGII